MRLKYLILLFIITLLSCEQKGYEDSKLYNRTDIVNDKLVSSDHGQFMYAIGYKGGFVQNVKYKEYITFNIGDTICFKSSNPDRNIAYWEWLKCK